MDLVNIVVIVAVLLIAWVLVDRFSPDATITYICKIIIFVVALVMILRLILPLAGLHLT